MARERSRYHDRIVTDPQVLAGKPVLRGTRIAVATVLGYLATNPDLNELFADYPEITVDDVRACLAHAEALVSGEAVTPAPPRPPTHAAARVV